MSGTASALVAPGAIVAGKYRLDAVIGEGGMGAVWSATHTGLGTAVAIKFISKEFVSSADALRRFDAEAKAAAQLRSRHVVQVFDNGALEDGTPYIAMELLRGENVYARVHRGGPVALPESVEILAQCAKALARAHAAGIIHRDIKPDNIFIAQPSDEEPLLVKILDFGIAKFATGPNDHGATRTGAVLGTPLYMSPEQARGLKSIDHRTDIYSLGLVAYTMLTGNLAFSSESFGDLLLQICTAPLPSLCANAPWLPASMEAWFQRACAREPQYRFGSAQEFAEALRAAAGDPRAAAAPLPMQPSTGAANPAHAVSVRTASGMSRSGDALGAPPGAKGKGMLVALAALVVLGAIGVAAFSLTHTGHGGDEAGSGSAAAVAPPPAQPPPAVATLADPAGSVPPVPPLSALAPTTPPQSPNGPEAVASSAQHAAGAVGPGSAHGGTVPGHAPAQVSPAGHAPTATTPSPAGQSQGPKPIDLGY
jgi:hypothetical protein